MFLLNSPWLVFSYNFSQDLQYKMFLLNKQVSDKNNFDLKIYNTKCFY